jgi:tRNA 2-thiouridine synthesizing protein E
MTNHLPCRFDNEGFLLDHNSWTEALAKEIALASGIVLNTDHWEIINLVRKYYAEFELSPVNRTLVKYVKTKLGADKGNSIYLNSLFSGSPAKLASKIAGLPKPTNCL